VVYSNGVASAASAPGMVTVPGTSQQINPNDPNQRYKAVNITKQPDVNAAKDDLMTTFKKNADTALQDFSSYLNNFKTDVATARTAAAKANDITPTVNALQSAQTQYSGDLSAADKSYQQALATGAANERGVVQQAQATLPQYNTAINNVENLQMDQLQKQLSRYKLGSGTPMSLGGDEEAQLIKGAREVATPLELAKIEKQQQILQGMALPVEQSIAGQNINYSGSFLPGVAGSRYGSATSTANSIQNLRNAVAGMTQQQAVAFMQAQGVPAAIMQQILSGEIGSLGGLSQLESSANYQGLQDVLGAYPSQPQAYNMQTGGFPTYPRRTGGTGTNNLGAPNAPTVVAPGDGTVDYNTLNQRNALARQQMSPNRSYAGFNNMGSQSNSVYDPNTGTYVDQTTGATTGYAPGYQQPVQYQGDADLAAIYDSLV